MGSPMPRDLSEEAVAEWAFLAAMGPESSETWADTDNMTKQDVYRLARAVRALVSAKVREAVFAARDDADETDGHVNAIVARVLGDHPEGGHEAEGREAPRG